MKIKLDTARKIPGPGQYATVDLTCKELKTSNMKNSMRSSVPKANRFRSFNFEVPSPSNYNVKTSELNSKYIKEKHVVFGSNKRNFIDDNWRLD